MEKEVRRGRNRRSGRRPGSDSGGKLEANRDFGRERDGRRIGVTDDPQLDGTGVVAEQDVFHDRDAVRREVGREAIAGDDSHAVPDADGRGKLVIRLGAANIDLTGCDRSIIHKGDVDERDVDTEQLTVFDAVDVVFVLVVIVRVDGHDARVGVVVVFEEIDAHPDVTFEVGGDQRAADAEREGGQG